MPKCNFNKFAKQHLWTADSTNCLGIKLVIYKFAFCCCFLSGAMAGCLKEVF